MTAKDKIIERLKKCEQENADLRERNCRMCKLNKQLVTKFVEYEMQKGCETTTAKLNKDNE